MYRCRAVSKILTADDLRRFDVADRWVGGALAVLRDRLAIAAPHDKLAPPCRLAGPRASATRDVRPWRWRGESANGEEMS